MARPKMLITLLSIFTLITLTTLIDITTNLTFPSSLLLLAFFLSAFSFITYLTLEIAAEIAPPSHTNSHVLETALRWQTFFNEEAHGLMLLTMACFAWFWTVAILFAQLLFTALFREATTFARLCGVLGYIPLVGTALAMFVYWATTAAFIVIFGFVIYTAGRSVRRLYNCRRSGFVENGVLLGQDEGLVSARQGVEEDDGEFGAWKGNQGSA